ncbi:MAG TPA: TIGR03643 family protein [Chitinophagaceae bacterium]|nr:TIGR03643 family protein [Chitinophagaceae bacterium]
MNKMQDDKPYNASNIKKKTIMELKEIDRIIEMAWEDRTPFEAIKIQFGLSEGNVIALMRRELKRSSFNLWRKRVNSGTSQKHLQKRSPDISRFKSSLQKAISMNKITKR